MSNNLKTRMAAETSSFYKLFTDLWRSCTAQVSTASETHVQHKPLMTDTSGSMNLDIVVALSAETSLLKAARVN